VDLKLLHDAIMSTDRAGGFTLIEVVVALALVTATSIGVASLFVASSRAVAASKAVTVAGLLAREKIEQLRALPLDDPALIPLGGDTLRDDVEGYNDAPAAGYRRRWSVTPVPMHPALAVAVQVNVIRDSGEVAARLVTIRTRKAA
jgi:prepilin-type N-terminal cleavage/methylation domain-containing protein